MKILITSSGFVSGSLVKALEQDDSVKEIVVWTDPSDKINTNKTTYTTDPDFENTGYDVIYHTYWNPRQASPPQEYIDNVQFTYDVLEMIGSQEKRPKFIFISSIVVKNPTTFYAASKVAGEALVNEYTSKGFIKGISVRPCAIVGKNGRGMLYDIVSKIRSDEKTLNLMTNSRKPFVHVDDVCRILKFIGLNKYERKQSTICSDFSMSVSEIAEMAMAKIDRKKEIVWGSGYIGDTDIMGGGSDWAVESVNEVINKAINDILEHICQKPR